jgi:hypothetical protein
MPISKLAKSPKFGVRLQMTSVTPEGGDERVWEVHDPERSRMFRVTLDPSVLQGAATGGAPSEAVVERAVLLAVERALVTPPEKETGGSYQVGMIQEDIEESRRLEA